MPILFNNKVVNLGTRSKEAAFVQEKVKWLRENLSEDGKHIVFVWDDSKQKPVEQSFRKFIRGFTQKRFVEPKGLILDYTALVPLFDDEGLTEIVYLRRAPQQENGIAVNVKKEKDFFDGRLVINLNRQPELAFFLYFCSPQCRAAEGSTNNSNGSNVFKAQNLEAESNRKNTALRSKLKVQTYCLNDVEDGGLSGDELKAIAMELLAISGHVSKERLKTVVHERLINDWKLRNEFIRMAESVMKKRPEKKELPYNPVPIIRDTPPPIDNGNVVKVEIPIDDVEDEDEDEGIDEFIPPPPDEDEINPEVEEVVVEVKEEPVKAAPPKKVVKKPVKRKPRSPNKKK